MDVAKLVREARLLAGMSSVELARASGVSRSSLHGFQTGRQSPTVRTLERVLAACDLQLRSVLEPLGADLDVQLDAALARPRTVELGPLLRFVDSLEERGVRWAVDGATAVALQGLALEHGAVRLAVVDDETTRSWLRHVWAQGYDRQGFPMAPSWDEKPEQVRMYVRHEVYTRLGDAKLRFVDELGQPVQLRVEGRVLPVLSLLDVEQAHADLAELLARFRQRAASPGGRTVTA